MAAVTYAPGDPKTPSHLRTKANGWNGSRYIGLPAPAPSQTGYPSGPIAPVPPVSYPGGTPQPPPRVMGSQGKTPGEWSGSTYLGPKPTAPYGAGGYPTGPIAQGPPPVSTPGGGAGPLPRVPVPPMQAPSSPRPSLTVEQYDRLTPAQRADYFAGRLDATGQPTGADGTSAGGGLVPGRAPGGFDQNKWDDPTHQTDKYVGGRLAAQPGATVESVLAGLPPGYTAIPGSTDKIRGPNGAILDLWVDEEGAHLPSWNRQGGTGSARQIASGRATDMRLNPQKYLPGGVHYATHGAEFAQQYPQQAGGGSGGSGGQPVMGQSSSYPATGATGTGYGDPNADLFANEVLSRLESLRTPINDPFLELLQSFGLDRVDDLGGAPYTSGEDAALRAQYMDPLTQARDTAKAQQTEQLGRYGYLPSSGLFQDRMGEVDQDYQGAVGRSSNDLAVRAIDEKNRRGDEQLRILQGLLGTSQDARAETDARGRELVTTANLLPAMDERRLDQTLRASGQGSNDQNALMSTLTQLMSMNQQNNQFNAQQQQQAALYNQQNGQQDSAAWGRYLGYLLQNWDQIFG